MAHESIRLKPEADGSIRIPAKLARQAGLESSEGVLVHVGVSRLILFSPLDPGAHLEAFAGKVKDELGDLNRSYQMSDGRTIEEYLDLSEEQRVALWEDAFREAMEALEKEPEQNASADYVTLFPCGFPTI